MTTYISPVSNLRITSIFGPRNIPGAGSFHPGIDIGISHNKGDPINAPTSGTIVGQFLYNKPTPSGQLTKNLLFLNDDGRLFLFSGLSKNDTLHVGAHVDAGVKIGEQGNTDNDQLHTHIELLNAQGVRKLGIHQLIVDGEPQWEVTADGKKVPIWELNRNRIGPGNEITSKMWGNATRPGLVYDKSIFLPPETVFPEGHFDTRQTRGQPNYAGWPPETWNAIWADQWENGNNPSVPQVRLLPFDSARLGIPPDMVGPYGYGTGQNGMSQNASGTFGPAFSVPFPGSGATPTSNDLPLWLGPGLGMMPSFPDSLHDPAESLGSYSDGRFVPAPHVRDLPIATMGPRPFGQATIPPEALWSFDPRSWVSPELRDITGIDAPVAPAAPPARRSALDDLPLPSPLLGGWTTPAAQSYPSSPFDTSPPPSPTRSLGPGLGMMQSFPDPLRDPATLSGGYAGDRAAGPLPSFDSAWWLSPELRSITGIDGPSAPTARPARRSALDDLPLPSPLMGGATTSAPQSYPASPLDMTSYDWRTGRWATSPAPGDPWPGGRGQLPFLMQGLPPIEAREEER